MNETGKSWHGLMAVLFSGGAALAACSPTITDLTPAAGAPGDTVVISGGRLTSGASNPVGVDFNGTAATTFAAAGATVQATVPAGATSGPVHVTTGRVDMMAPGGTATSPYDFTIVQTIFAETEPNDSRAAAGNAGMADVLQGSVSDTDPADWFKISSGAAGPWGYAVEIVVQPQTLPPGVTLRVDMEGYRSDLSAIGSLATYHDTGTYTLWTTQAPGTDIYFNVHASGSTSESYNSGYVLTIARIPITDGNETDDTLAAANTIAMVDGQGSHTSSYLCTIMQGGGDVGMQDFYSFAGGDATQISLIVATPSLNAADGVYVELYDSVDGYRGGGAGNPSAVSHVYTLPVGETATGTWKIEVTNAWDHYATAGAGPADQIPLSCKAPYRVTILTE